MENIKNHQRDYMDISTEIAITRHENIKELTDIGTDVAIARYEYSVPSKRKSCIHEDGP